LRNPSASGPAITRSLDHRIANLDGDFNYGTHPILDFSGLPEGAGRISTSPMRWASRLFVFQPWL
jgi:hypothetical protein